MPDEIAIKVGGVYKNFVLPHQRSNTIKSLFTNLTQKHNKGSEVQHALKDISFDIKQGEFFGIVGRNGSGKSTLLKILAGIYQPTSGQVQTKGKLVPFIELGVGFNMELTGRQNVYLNGAMLGFSHSEVESMYDEIVKFAELERFMDQKLKNYSSGMQVRLAFSMAVRAEADILLVDEVLAVGDADFQRKCFEYFKKLKKAKKTVVFVSHDMEAVREYCDRAVLIEKNSIIASGTPAEVTKHYTKLFTAKEGARSGPDTARDERWGDGSAITSSVNVDVKEEEIVINQLIKAKSNLEAPIAGFRLRSSAGMAISGTNTKIERQPVPDLKKGDTVKVTWSFPNVLSDGEYIVDPSIIRDDNITVCDWWDDAVQFVVNKQRHLPYPVDMPFEVKVKD